MCINYIFINSRFNPTLCVKFYKKLPYELHFLRGVDNWICQFDISAIKEH